MSKCIKFRKKKHYSFSSSAYWTIWRNYTTNVKNKSVIITNKLIWATNCVFLCFWVCQNVYLSRVWTILLGCTDQSATTKTKLTTWTPLFKKSNPHQGRSLPKNLLVLTHFFKKQLKTHYSSIILIQKSWLIKKIT